MSPEPTVWKIALRDELRVSLGTNPSPDWGETESERDWYLEKMLHRPREDYTVEEVPGPIRRAIYDEIDRFQRVRKEIRDRRKAEWRPRSEARGAARDPSRSDTPE